MIIGAGPTGVKVANELLKNSDDLTVKIFNGESTEPYNRAQLSYFLAGDVPLNGLSNRLEERPERLREYQACKIERICSEDKVVTDQNGEQHPYEKLIIATGSTVRAPSIDGDDKAGVYYFRSLLDAEELLQRRKENQNVYVIGSGPLGIETALAMKTHSNRVYLQVRSNLFTADLDENAKIVLSDYIRSNGVEIIDNALVDEIVGNSKVSAVKMNNGNQLDVDVVIMCTGVSPLKELANKAGVDVNKGILVDDFMRTNNVDIYAIGEVAEHLGITHGLISPGYEQAEVCVSHIINQAKPYSGKPGELHLKFRNFSSQIIGDTNAEGFRTIIYKNSLKNIYRKLIIDGRKINGAVIVGEWGESGRVASLIQSEKRIERGTIKRYLESGNLWSDQTVPLVDQPEDYIICLCKGVTRGEISMAMEKGHRSLASLGVELDAGVTCGSCQPLISSMLQQPVKNLIMRHYKKIFYASLISVAMILMIFFSPKLPFDRSVQFSFQFEKIWYGSIYKLSTGYVLLGLMLLASGLSVRKRWKRLNHGNLDNWRFAHTLLGLMALLAVIVHTGFRMGENLSFALMFVFLLATLTGSVVGVFMSRNHHWTDIKLTQYRAWWSRVHYGLLWLLPALLGFHILSSYYFA